jgi:uncharacterized membrane protein YkvA (DUF1232 family)
MKSSKTKSDSSTNSYEPQSEAEVHKSFLSYFKKNKSKLNFPERVEALYVWLTSGGLETKDKALIVGALLYFINPMDAMPDITPFLGFVDDIGVVGLVYRYLQNRAIEEKVKKREPN